MEGSEQQNGAGYKPLLESSRGTFLPARASGSAVSQKRAWSSSAACRCPRPSQVHQNKNISIQFEHRKNHITAPLQSPTS
jgi:hypothetical protein